MSAEIELTMRGPDAFRLARSAIEGMETHQIWPTPLNYELWIHYLGNPDSELGQAISQLLTDGKSLTESVAEGLAAQFLPKARLNDEIRDAGDKLNAQLENISAAIKTAQKSTDAYGKALAGAHEELADEDLQAPVVARLVQTLTNATRTVQKENASLEQRLNASTEEVSRLREHLEQVRREAMTDALTLLANRKALDDCLARACSEADMSGKPVTLAVIDIDHFKRFNDTWGHQTGDQVIRYVASVIGRIGATPRLAARYGGEEFALVCPEEALNEVARELETIRREIGSRTLKRRSTNEDLGAVTVSVGMAQYRRGEGAASLLDRADSALYASKRAGRDRVSFADADQAAA